MGHPHSCLPSFRTVTVPQPGLACAHSLASCFLFTSSHQHTPNLGQNLVPFLLAVPAWWEPPSPRERLCAFPHTCFQHSRTQKAPLPTEGHTPEWPLSRQRISSTFSPLTDPSSSPSPHPDSPRGSPLLPQDLCTGCT